MKKLTVFVCKECAHSTSKWIGKCPGCGNWNTFEEEENLQGKKGAKLVKKNQGKKSKLINEIDPNEYHRFGTGINEFDRVLGGGLVNGSLILVGGEPGIGKSTLLMELASKLSANLNVLYVSGEESEGQIVKRSKRMNLDPKTLYLLYETSWENILEHIKELKPDIFILDSIQTANSHELPSAAGTVSQIKEITYQIMNYSKAYGMTSFIIGHVTKEGTIAGPKLLEHMVDTVVYFEGDQFGHYRLLRAIKNRFGNTQEIGIFEMTERGLLEVENPSQYFLIDSSQESYGRSLSCIVEGSRSLFVEIQALVVENKYGNGRRTTQGIDNNRLAMLIAVIEKYFEIPLGFQDIYVNVAGGIKLKSRETDLAIMASVLSSFRQTPLDVGIVFLGEVGLTGEVRSVPRVETRLKEMVQLNYKKVVTSLRTAKEYSGKFDIQIIGIEKAKDLEKVI